MNFLGIIAIVESVISIILKAIPFVEQLFEKGTDKKSAVMSLAEMAADSATDKIIANNPNWAFIKPMADKFIDDVIAAVNAAETAAKG
jgi:hypothetical protein